MPPTRFLALRSSPVCAALMVSCFACSLEDAAEPTVLPFGNAPDSVSTDPDTDAVPPDDSEGSEGSESSTTADLTEGEATPERPVTPRLVEPIQETDDSGQAAAGAETEGATEGEETDGVDDSGEPLVEPRPSAVCGSGGASLSFDLPNTLFSVPDSYDGSTPLPVVLAFHAAGNPNTQMRSIIGSTFEGDYILLYPKSDGNGWSNQADAPKVEAMFAALDATACYDQNRVFAAGHSSGAQFIVQRLCAGESRWRAIAPVASSVYCSSWTPIPALVIHGIGDEERIAYGLDDGDGLKDIVPYRTSNGCEESSTEVVVEGCNSGGVQVDPGCRDFNGCSETTRWCQHTDPQYGTSHHGVPCFGARVMRQFFDTYQ